jgi:hypothetical protein
MCKQVIWQHDTKYNITLYHLITEMTSKQVQEDNETMSDDIYKLLKKYQAIRSIIKTLGVSKYRNTTQARPGSLLPFSHHAEGLVKHKSHEKRLLILDTPDRACRFIQTPSTQGYIVRFGQCSVFLIPINKRRHWKLVLSLTDGALYCS